MLAERKRPWDVKQTGRVRRQLAGAERRLADPLSDAEHRLADPGCQTILPREHRAGMPMRLWLLFHGRGDRAIWRSAAGGVDA
ncbi:hypothetical protein [Streptomyces sp. NPDC048196]|uniref:hypothetical protein n=1 Tax=Streptomyces sp. NPDC048196 TaxID=3154712 RepID=UPI0033C6DCFB